MITQTRRREEQKKRRIEINYKYMIDNTVEDIPLYRMEISCR
jgi:hypothetical protein